MWQAEPTSTTQPIKDQPIAQPPGMSGPAPTTAQRGVFNPGVQGMPTQAKANGLTSWLGSGNNPQLTQVQPGRGGMPAGQNPYLKLAGANANRSRLGRGFQTPNRGFQRGLGQAYQNFLGGQAGNQGNPKMRRPGGRGFRDQFRRGPRPRVNRGDMMKKLRGVGRGGPWDNQLVPGSGQIGQQPPPMTTQPVPMPAPEYAAPTISNPQISSGGQMEMLQPTQLGGFTR